MKQAIAILVAIVIIGGGAYLFFGGKTDQADKKSDSMAMESQDAMEKSGSDAMEGDSMEKTEDDAMEAEGTMTYTIAEGSTASYIVQKGWLSKPSEEVVGVTTEVTGKIGFAENTDSSYQLTVSANIAPNFDSGSGGRDNHVKGLFEGNIGVALNETYASDIREAGTYTSSLSLDVTINGVTQAVPANITITADGESLTVSGSADFVMSSFGIEPPSIAGLYNVADAMSIEFEIEAI